MIQILAGGNPFAAILLAYLIGALGTLLAIAYGQYVERRSRRTVAN